MAADYFNSLGGFSVGIPSIEVIDSNGNVVTNVLTNGNVAANVFYGSFYNYANGVSIIAGNTTEIQFNNNGVLNASNRLTFDTNTSTLTANNLSVTNKSNLGNVENITIQGGLNGYFLQTDGTGNLTWAAGGSGGGNGSPGGANTQIQFNDAGTFGGDNGFTYNKNTNTLSVENSVLSVANISIGNISNAIVNTANISNLAASNITVGNRINANTISSVTGNVQFIGNVNIGFQANLNVTDVNNLRIQGGLNGYFLQTDGSGNLTWSAAGSGNGSPGGSNTQVQYNKNGVFTGSPFLTFNDSNNTFQIAGTLSANSIQLGSGVYKYSSSRAVIAATNNNSPNQVIYSVPSNNISGIDFEVTAVDEIGNIKNSFVITSLLNGTVVDYVEYEGIYMNGSVGDFAVEYNPGDIISPSSIELKVSPSTSAQVVYKMLVTTYDN